MTAIEEIEPLGSAEFDAEIRPRHRPIVIRGAATDWPIVSAARRSAEAAIGYLKSLDTGAPTATATGRPTRKPDTMRA